MHTRNGERIDWTHLGVARSGLQFLLNIEAASHGVRRQSPYEKRDEEPSRQVPFEVGMVLATRIRSGDMCNADAPRCCQLRIASSFAVAQLLCNRPTQPSRPHTFGKLASFESPFLNTFAQNLPGKLNQHLACQYIDFTTSKGFWRLDRSYLALSYAPPGMQ